MDRGECCKMKEKSHILLEAESMRDWLIQVRRDFHRNPELGLEEFRTREKIIQYLEEMGIKYETSIDSTAVVGLIKGNKEGKTVALRADMDALPIQDRKISDYKSMHLGKMHACGHDVHMTILLGAAKILKKWEKKINGNVKLFFQPAEETVGGAKEMIKKGAMQNPKVDYVLGLHVCNEIPVGQIGVKFNQMSASSDAIKITLHGESAHGAYPHSGIDTIVVAGQIITAIQTITSRNVDPRHSAVVTIGTIKGGFQGNIIAHEVEMTGTVRTLDEDTRTRVMNRLKTIVCHTAEAFEARGELFTEEGYPYIINDNRVVEIIQQNGEDLLGPDNVRVIESISLGVEDFAYFLQEAPGAYFRLGTRNDKKGIIHDVHNSLFDVDEDCLPIGAALQVANAIKILNK
jgi:amidohydrolase